MAELIEIGEQQERVILFAASTNDSDDTEESVEELKELVKTAGAETVGTVIQNRENIHPGTYLGKGKIQELKEMVWDPADWMFLSASFTCFYHIIFFCLFVQKM